MTNAGNYPAFTITIQGGNSKQNGYGNVGFGIALVFGHSLYWLLRHGMRGQGICCWLSTTGTSEIPPQGRLAVGRSLLGRETPRP
jgi:hypothetical protein